MAKKKLITIEQVGFKANKGCDDTLLHIDYYIIKVLSAKNHVNILSNDFEKAFDRIGLHVILHIQILVGHCYQIDSSKLELMDIIQNPLTIKLAKFLTNTSLWITAYMQMTCVSSAKITNPQKF